MKRLSLEELKAQKGEQVKETLVAINGGVAADCHCGWCEAYASFLEWYHQR